jgi:hypothetical protein
LLKVPPVMTVNVPAAAIAIPRTCLLVNGSLNMRAEKTLMRIGERRQTRMAAIEAPAICIPVYCMVKKNVTPVKARSNSFRKSLLSTRAV